MNKGRKISGGKYHANRKKKFYEKQNQERVVTLKETKRKSQRPEKFGVSVKLFRDWKFLLTKFL